MSFLPQLNQKCEYWQVVRSGDRAKRTKEVLYSDIACRFSEATQTFRDQRGQDIEYHANLHCDYAGYDLVRGNCITIDGKNYQIVEATKVPHIDGTYRFWFLRLKEYAFVEI